MSDDRELGRSLDGIEAKAGQALRRARLRDGVRQGARIGATIALVVPSIGVVLALLSHFEGFGAPALLPLVVATAVVFLLTVGLVALAAGLQRVSRRGLLGLVDDRLELADRLVAADEFRALPERGPFHEAALRDASSAVERARSAALDFAKDTEPVRPHLLRALPIAAGLLVLAVVLRGTPGEDDPYFRRGDPEQVLARAEAAGDALDVESPLQAAIAQPEAQPETPREPAGATAGSAPEPTDLDSQEKPSSGKASPGKGGTAKGASGASQARGAPTGQTPEAKEPSKPKKTETKRREAKAVDVPQPEKKTEEEDSGSTAGKGSSKGSNKNPVTSSWKSRDQVSSDDNAEVEDDSDSEDEDEEQENRGGVQPSMRDRRPPASRDLQISFGNRPNPDANGRGGPSQPKKSRGVASLVLGVPIPDRVKGRPGAGRTKITQERVEPEAEEAPAPQPELRAARRGPSGGPPPLDLDPITRAIVRAYFRRVSAPPSSPPPQ